MNFKMRWRGDDGAGQEGGGKEGAVGGKEGKK